MIREPILLLQEESNMKKVIISLLLCIMMAFGLLSSAAYAKTADNTLNIGEQSCDECMMTLQSTPTPITSVSVTGVKTPVAGASRIKTSQYRPVL